MADKAAVKAVDHYIIKKTETCLTLAYNYNTLIYDFQTSKNIFFVN